MYNQNNNRYIPVHISHFNTGFNMLAVCSKNQDFLYRQTRDWLVRQMRTGKLKPGSKLPGERALADLLKISRGTARNALQGLEEEGLIERIPSRGAFIRQEERMRAMKIALVFPEAGISREYLEYAGWLNSIETQRGLLEGGIEFNSELSFVHCSETSVPEKYAERLTKDFDGVVFLSWQLNELREELSRHKFPFIVIGEEKAQPCIIYDRSQICQTAARYLWDCGCQSASILLGAEDSPSLPEKQKAVEKFFHKKTELLILDQDEEKAYEKLKKLLPEDSSLLPDAFFCTTAVTSFALLRLSNERSWKIPDDFMIMGYANDMKIRPTTPLLTYVRVPYYEMGKIACKLLADRILNNKEIPNITVVPAELITGKTTNKIKS
jgi:DNA-binding LacI/PurR family transcriptional regulator